MKILTVQTVSIRTIAVASMVAAVAVLSGCAATSHIGDDWQCPVVHGAPCQSVVEADPARAGTLQGEPTVAAGNERLERCDGECRPFGWLRRALAGGNAPAGGNALAGGNERVTETEPSTGRDAESGERHGGEPNGENLRLPEVVGRIWIAPYVDDKGVYHEASWVRIVLQPARWKLP